MARYIRSSFFFLFLILPQLVKANPHFSLLPVVRKSSLVFYYGKDLVIPGGSYSGTGMIGLANHYSLQYEQRIGEARRLGIMGGLDYLQYKYKVNNVMDGTQDVRFLYNHIGPVIQVFYQTSKPGKLRLFRHGFRAGTSVMFPMGDAPVETLDGNQNVLTSEIEGTQQGQLWNVHIAPYIGLSMPTRFEIGLDFPIQYSVTEHFSALPVHPLRIGASLTVAWKFRTKESGWKGIFKR